jgi:hypothetical protein
MKKLIFIFVFLFCFIQIKSENISIDSNQYVILKFDKDNGLIFNKKYKPSDINKQEIESIYILIGKAISDYHLKNASENTLNQKNYEIDLSNYKIQLIPVINPKGEKEIFVNCICLTSSEINNWENGIIIVLDGGKCYFQLKISLKKNKYYNFMINGEA